MATTTLLNFYGLTFAIALFFLGQSNVNCPISVACHLKCLEKSDVKKGSIWSNECTFHYRKMLKIKIYSGIFIFYETFILQEIKTCIACLVLYGQKASGFSKYLPMAKNQYFSGPFIFRVFTFIEKRCCLVFVF